MGKCRFGASLFFVSGMLFYIYFWFFSNFSTKPQFLYEGAIFLKKFNIKN